MKPESVALCIHTIKKPDGQTYRYWVLRWWDADHKRQSQTLGAVQDLSKRQANKLRKQKEAELSRYPARRTPDRAPALGMFLDDYYRAREHELASGTLGLHKQTGAYLKGHFGEHRRLNRIGRQDARAFKTALAEGDLMHVSKRPRRLTSPTIDMHIRNARTLFNRAVDDDLIDFNPFDRLSEKQAVTRDWHYVGYAEFVQLLDATTSRSWRVLLALCRWAGLRRGEALNLRWHNIDWTRNRLTVIASEDWQPKDRDARTVPIGPELQAELLAAYGDAPEGSEHVIPSGSIIIKNTWRDFGVLCKRAGIPRYRKPLHSLRKSCITDWAGLFPTHVVMQWAGHADIRTTNEHYLKVCESDYECAAGASFAARLDKTLAKTRTKPPNPATDTAGETDVNYGKQRASEKAGDRIRTDDVQLGKLAFYH